MYKTILKTYYIKSDLEYNKIFSNLQKQGLKAYGGQFLNNGSLIEASVMRHYDYMPRYYISVIYDV